MSPLNPGLCVADQSSIKQAAWQLREALEDIASDGHRASEVISRIRSLVKKQVPEKSPADLNEIAREVIALVNHEAQRNQVTVHSELSHAAISVLADRVQLRRASGEQVAAQVWDNRNGSIILRTLPIGA